MLLIRMRNEPITATCAEAFYLYDLTRLTLLSNHLTDLPTQVKSKVCGVTKVLYFMNAQPNWNLSCKGIFCGILDVTAPQLKKCHNNVGVVASGCAVCLSDVMPLCCVSRKLCLQCDITQCDMNPTVK